jgi:hypothetical protein
MRAEPHYVEALARPRVEPLPAPPPPDVAAMNVVADRRFGVINEALGRALESLNASLGELQATGRPLRERLLLELARAEAVRAGWLAGALMVLQSEPLPALDQVNLGAVVARVADALGPEHRLTGESPTITRNDVPARVFGDERLLTVAVGGMLQAMCACVDGRSAPSNVAMRVTSPREGATRGVEVLQTAVRMPASMLGRLFESDWAEHPAGPTGAVLLAAARRIAALQGGTLEARPLDGGGCRLVLTLPAAE